MSGNTTPPLPTIDDEFNESLSRNYPLIPERKLVYALLEFGLREYQLYTKTLSIKENKYCKNLKRKHFSSIDAWVFSNLTHPFSLIWCAQHITPDWESLVSGYKQRCTEMKEFHWRQMRKKNKI